ncbi:hypothetical protein PG997_011725 [Apiospora hydei]|uniref:Uncharacterized protein n=1 Tax=Apiospora hydei TaxID=1337664 RepID=A0ABR1V1B8_9PEZI
MFQDVFVEGPEQELMDTHHQGEQDTASVHSDQDDAASIHGEQEDAPSIHDEQEDSPSVHSEQEAARFGDQQDAAADTEKQDVIMRPTGIQAPILEANPVPPIEEEFKDLDELEKIARQDEFAAEQRRARNK